MIKSPERSLEQERPSQSVKALQRAQYWSRPGIHFVLSILISGVFLYLALRAVDLTQVWQELQLARPAPLGLALCAAIASNLFRAIRWKVILGSRSEVRLRFFFTSMMIGYLANNLLPARMGELVRIYALERKAGVSKSTAAATVILERLTDSLVLLVLVVLTSFFLPLPAVLRSVSHVALTVFAALAVFLMFLASRGKNLAGLAIRRMDSLSFGVSHKLQGVLDGFIDGLGIFRNSKHALFTFALTLVIWGIEAVSVTLVMASLGLSLPWIASLLLVVVLSLSFIIPAAPGAVGTYEFFAVTALTPFAVGNSQAIGLALVLHAVTYATSTVLGLACLWMESLSLRELIAKAPKEVHS